MMIIINIYKMSGKLFKIIEINKLNNNSDEFEKIFGMLSYKAFKIINNENIIYSNMDDNEIISETILSENLTIVYDTIQPSYRYWLKRQINDKPNPKYLLFIMFNPSTADDIIDDNTIRKLINITIYNGYDGFYVGNLYARRSTNPNVIKNNLLSKGPKMKNILMQC